MQRWHNRTGWALMAAAEVLERYFSGWGRGQVPLGKCGVQTTSWAPQARAPDQERNPNNIQLWSYRVSLCHREMARDAENLLKGQHKKICLQPLTTGSGRGRAEGTRAMWEELGLVPLGRELKSQQPSSLYLVIPQNAEATFLEQSTPLHTA